MSFTRGGLERYYEHAQLDLQNSSFSPLSKKPGQYTAFRKNSQIYTCLEFSKSTSLLSEAQTLPLSSIKRF